MKKKILIIDDAEVNQMLLSRMLEKYEVLSASNGAQGLELVQANADTLALIILDIVLPETTGVELLEKIKADPATMDIPVIVMSAQHQTEEQVMELGAIDFWRKPFYAAKEIQERVARIVGY
ncbi:MAG: response regulator [Anaerovibrio sp.]|uniref:response regulator n=1 Tax=Anaerovibrio sp. TaxID=1872532 RepID=UPI0025F6A55F|nr:response regulator [Anaerovibrio sp.]MCR5177252.1 response regulator [Anaerovibrio sp.]